MKTQNNINPIFQNSKFYNSKNDVFPLSHLNVKQTIKSTKGKFFSVTFIKADGTERKMVCRFGVSIGVNGNGKQSQMEDMNVKVYDIQKHAWRSFRLDRLVSFKCGLSKLTAN